MRRKILPYNPKLKPLAKALRNDMTLSEVLLWNELKQKKMLGYDFDRQRPIDNYIVDMANVLRTIEYWILEHGENL